MIVVIACGDNKAQVPKPACEMYQGQHFKLQLEYARSIAHDHQIFIISAKYGLLRLYDRIEPYDVTLKSNKALSVATVRAQADRLRIRKQPCIVIGGLPYRKLIRQVFADVYAPFAKYPEGILPANACRMGYQKQAMKQHMGHIPRLENK